MNVRALIIGAITPITLTSCIGGTNCDAAGEKYEEEFSIDYGVTQAEVDNLMQSEGFESITEITCDDLCAYFVTGELQISSCDYQLSSEPQDTADGVGHITCAGISTDYAMCEGRRPQGYHEPDINTKEQYFAHVAQLEAASVLSFVQLAKQLHGWGAPRELIHRCIQAAKDEVVHARDMSKVAHDNGQVVPKIIIEQSSEAMLDVAIHNAVEGCVFETWAALEASLKAQLATDTKLRRVYRRIAHDETQHAQLSWDLHQWFLQQLPEAQKQVVQKALKEAIQKLMARGTKHWNDYPEVLGMYRLQGAAVLQQFVTRLAA